MSFHEYSDRLRGSISKIVFVEGLEEAIYQSHQLFFYFHSKPWPWIPWPLPSESPYRCSVSSFASPLQFPLVLSVASYPAASPSTFTPLPSASSSPTSPSASPPTSTSSYLCSLVTPPCSSFVPDAASSLSSSDLVTSLAGIIDLFSHFNSIVPLFDLAPRF